MLSEALPNDYTKAQAAELFYPGQAPPAIDQGARRRPGFLATLSDAALRDVYEHVAAAPQPRPSFLNIHRLLRLSKDDGRILYQVLDHIASWLKLQLTQVLDRRVIDKPPLRNDFIPALQHWTDALVDAAAEALPTFRWPREPAGAPEAASVLLQHEVLELAVASLAYFRSPGGKASLEQRLEGDDDSRYRQRFSDRPWRALLDVVRRYTNKGLHTEWTARRDDRTAIQTSASPQSITTLARSLCQHLRDTPPFTSHPDLCHIIGSEPVQRTIRQWLVEALPVADHSGPPSSREPIASSLVEETPPPSQSAQAPPGSLVSDKEDPSSVVPPRVPLPAPDLPTTRLGIVKWAEEKREERQRRRTQQSLPSPQGPSSSASLTSGKKRIPSWMRGPRAG